MSGKLNIEIFEASSVDEKEILRNLLALYLHDLSEFTADLDINERGFFEYEGLNMYYQKETLSPLLYKVDGEYAGFILFNEPPYAPEDVDYNINEFFLLRKYRGKGIAQEVTKELFRQYPGRYMILQLVANTPAIKFWHKVYRNSNLEYTETEKIYDGLDCILQKVEIPSL